MFVVAGILNASYMLSSFMPDDIFKIRRWKQSSWDILFITAWRELDRNIKGESCRETILYQIFFSSLDTCSDKPDTIVFLILFPNCLFYFVHHYCLMKGVQESETAFTRCLESFFFGLVVAFLLM